VFCWNVDTFFPVTISVTGFFPASINPGFGVEYPFASAGSYTMTDNYGDSCSITVGTTAEPPVASFIYPVEGGVVPANTPFDIQVSAAGEAGMYSVDFWVEDLSDYSWYQISTDYTAPFTATTNLTVGAYNLYVYATDNANQLDYKFIGITAAAITTTPSALENPRRVEGQFLFDVTGLTGGKPHVVQYRSDLSTGSWVSVATNTAAGATATVTLPSSVEPRVYRVYQMP